MNITLIEPYFTGSHADWAKGFARHSRHSIDILKLSGSYWKWRMQGGAVTLAAEFLKSDTRPDLILVTDMLDLTTFLALTRQRTAGIPVAIYFHESQICYPWLPTDRDVKNKRNHHYGFINYSSALAADRVLFNSQYHFTAFFNELHRFLKHFPDHNELDTVDIIRNKSKVLHLGLDLQKLDNYEALNSNLTRDIDCEMDRHNDIGMRPPLILWNHRWEYDKNPEEFFQALYFLQDQGLDFHLAMLGESFGKPHPVFEEARSKLQDRVVHFGYANDHSEYASWLHRADIIPVTSNHDFFGASLVEALYCRCYPLVPKRLTYPELLPISEHPEVFYKDLDDLVIKLERAIREIDSIRKTEFRQCVAKFDWRRIVVEYDQLFEDLVERS